MLKESGGTFVFDVEFPENGKSQRTGFRWQGWPQRGDGRVLYGRSRVL